MAVYDAGNIQALGTNLLGDAQKTLAGLQRHPDIIQFLEAGTNKTLLTCDAIISESLNQSAQISNYPLEDAGQGISDHIFIDPPELKIEGVVSDSPIGTSKGLIKEAVASALTAFTPPLVMAAAGIAYGGIKALIDADSPSQTQFDNLIKMMVGQPNTVPPVPPKPFIVISKYATYENMVIKSLSVPRDASVHSTLVFSMTLVKLKIVRAQNTTVQVSMAPQLTGDKAAEGEKELVGQSGAAQGAKAADNFSARVEDAANSVLSKTKTIYENIRDFGISTFKGVIGGLSK